MMGVFGQHVAMPKRSVAIFHIVKVNAEKKLRK